MVTGLRKYNRSNCAWVSVESLHFLQSCLNQFQSFNHNWFLDANLIVVICTNLKFPIVTLTYSLLHCKVLCPSHPQNELDDAVGTIMSVLKEAGIDDNTFVFFTSDNGWDGHAVLHRLVTTWTWWDKIPKHRVQYRLQQQTGHINLCLGCSETLGAIVSEQPKHESS